MNVPNEVVKKAHKNCCVSDCESKDSEMPDITFYNFPKAKSSFIKRKNLFGNDEVIDRRIMYMRQLKIDVKSDVSSLLVCSKHFEKSDYSLPGL